LFQARFQVTASPRLDDGKMDLSNKATMAGLALRVVSTHTHPVLTNQHCHAVVFVGIFFSLGIRTEMVRLFFLL
jgi:hypothetical protein